MNHIFFANKDWPAHFGTGAIMKLEELTGQPFFKLLFSVIPKAEDILDENIISESAEEMEVRAAGIGLGAIQQTNISVMVKILFCALWGGAMKLKQPFNYSVSDIADLLDDEGQDKFVILFEAVGMAFNSLPKGEENGQVSKKKQTPQANRKK